MSCPGPNTIRDISREEVLNYSAFILILSKKAKLIQKILTDFSNPNKIMIILTQ